MEEIDKENKHIDQDVGADVWNNFVVEPQRALFFGKENFFIMIRILFLLFYLYLALKNNSINFFSK